MGRVFWLGIGAAIGSFITRRLSTLRARLTPRGIAQALTTGVLGVGYTAKDAAAGVRTALAERGRKPAPQHSKKNRWS